MLQQGDLLQNRYGITGRLGQGGMGLVYRAEDNRLGGRPVAVKVFSTSQVPPAEQGWRLAAFQQEAEMVARLHHPGLTDVFDFFSEGDNAYVVMEYVEGERLDSLLNRSQDGRLPGQQAVEITVQLCQVLAYLHGQQPPVVFRDLKPDNLMFRPDGRLKLIDFGIARFFKAGQTQDTQPLGTPGYASPEQYGRRQTDPRSDIYSLGVLLHQMVTGYDPVDSPLMLPPVMQLNPAVPPHLAAAVERATRHDPTQRFQNIAEFQAALVPGTIRLGPTQTKRPVPWIMAATVGVVVLLLIGGFWLAQRPGSDSPASPAALVAIEPGDVTTSSPTLAATATEAMDKGTPTDSPTATAEPPTATLPPTATHTPAPTATPALFDLNTLGGDSPVQLTAGDGDEYVASLSPDQRTLVLMTDESGFWQLVVMNVAAGDGWVNISNNNTNNYHPHFSPDGEWLVIGTEVTGNWEIARLRPDGSDFGLLVARPSADTYPSYSPDGQWIVYMSNRVQDWGVYLMRADGSEDRPVIDTASAETFPTWSADGRQIVYQSNASGNHDIYLISVDGGPAQQVTADPARDAAPVMSPDGQWIAFETNRDGDYEIYLVRPDGSGLHNLTQHPADDQVPWFSPDGEWVIFQSDRNGSVDIFMQRVE
jgi:serine/threonine protein kinase